MSRGAAGLLWRRAMSTCGVLLMRRHKSARARLCIDGLNAMTQSPARQRWSMKLIAFECSLITVPLIACGGAFRSSEFWVGTGGTG